MLSGLTFWWYDVGILTFDVIDRHNNKSYLVVENIMALAKHQVQYYNTHYFAVAAGNNSSNNRTQNGLKIHPNQASWELAFDKIATFDLNEEEFTIYGYFSQAKDYT